VKRLAYTSLVKPILTFDLRLQGQLQSFQECKIRFKAFFRIFISELVKAAEANFDIFKYSRLKLGTNFGKKLSRGFMTQKN